MKTWSEKAIQRIVNDLCGRSGLGNEWDAIDGSTKREIKREWARAVDTAYAEHMQEPERKTGPKP